MPMQTWQQTLVSAAGDGTALGNSTTATSIIPTAAKFTLPANYFYTAGQWLRVQARGRVSNIVTAPGNITFDVRFGTAVVFNGGALALNTTAKTNVTWELEVDLVCRAVGSGTSATILGIGHWSSESYVGAAANTAVTASVPLSAPVVGTGFDSTAAQAVDLFGTFSTANAGNTITLHHYMLQSMN